MYCSVDDMVEVFSLPTMTQISQRPGTDRTLVNTPVVEKAIKDASAEINMYLDSRGLLPVTDIPEILTRICCDMAFYYLHLKPTTEGAVSMAYKTRVRQLEKVASGSLSLGLTQSGNVTEPEDVVIFNPGRNVWRNDRGAW
ncbi:DUF1320 domain-containing protein [Klebsiella indica]|uniref:gp436 family protein n=1 Tax=Klebsiella TaxID=570 RepID=UPI0037501CD8